MKNGDSIYVDCDCAGNCTALHFTVFQRNDKAREGPEMYAQVYRQARDRGKRFWRLRAAWYAFKNGEWGGCELCLDEERIVKLAQACHFALGSEATSP